MSFTLDCFRVLDVVHCAAVNIGVHIWPLHGRDLRNASGAC